MGEAIVMSFINIIMMATYYGHLRLMMKESDNCDHDYCIIVDVIHFILFTGLWICTYFYYIRPQ